MTLNTEFTFETFDQAFIVHREMFRKAKSKGYLTYQDLCMLIDEESGPFHTIEYGWTDLSQVKLIQNENGKWVLKIPQVENLKKEN